jgi:CubicO group peptidase (beta-lactamase class C family)
MRMQSSAMRLFTAGLLAFALVVTATGCTSAAAPNKADAAKTASQPVASDSKQGKAIAAIVRKAMDTYQLRAVIVEVKKGDKVITTQAFGDSMDGVPATTDMNFRNGAVAFAYIGTLLMLYVEQHKVKLDDTIDKWLPDLPESNKVTLKMLTNQTSGYPDFETDAGWTAAFNTNPFQIFSYESRVKYAFDRPMQFAPGTNWSYAHTNFMILGKILAMVGKAPLDQLLKKNVLDPMGLKNTAAFTSSYIPEPVLHSYSSERRVQIGVPDGKPFYEEATYFNAAWGTPDGAAQTTTIADMTTTAAAVGTGKLLSKSSFHAMTDPNLLGFGHKEQACLPSCFTQVAGYNYGLGIVRSGSWILQDPLVGGYSATEAYLPSQKMSISVVTTFKEGAFDCGGVEANSSDTVFRLIGAYTSPDDAPPVSPTTQPPTGCH